MRIILNGPIASPGLAASGGYAAANRRTAEALKRRGVGVIEAPYPLDADGATEKMLAYAAAFFATWRQVLRNKDYDLLHLTPLNMHFALPEFVTLLLAKVARRPVLFDIRAGTFDTHFERGSWLYRFVIGRSLRYATRVAIEGTRYAPLVRRFHRAAPWYFPNYVASDVVDPAPRARAAPSERSRLNLLYVGRMVEEKGIGTALATTRILVRSGIAATLHLVGTGEPRQLDRWRRDARDLPVHWHGALPAAAVMATAALSHFFLFPSRHAGEGHSNALNEAMAAGVVPVASDQGFSRDIVAEAGVVLPVSASAEDYADAIRTILREHRWSDLSRSAARRIAQRYSEDVLVPELLTLYAQATDGEHAAASRAAVLDTE